MIPEPTPEEIQKNIAEEQSTQIAHFIRNNVEVFILLLFISVIAAHYAYLFQAKFFCMNILECRVYTEEFGFISLAVISVIFGYVAKLFSVLTIIYREYLVGLFAVLSILSIVTFFCWFDTYDRITPQSSDSVFIGFTDHQDLSSVQSINVQWTQRQNYTKSMTPNCMSNITLTVDSNNIVPFNSLTFDDVSWFSTQKNIPINEIPDGYCSLLTAKKNNANYGWIEIGTLIYFLGIFIKRLIFAINKNN